MNSSPFKTLCILAGASLAMATSASALVYWDNTFSTETVNTAFGTPNAGYNTNLAPVNVGAYSLSGGMTLPTFAPASSTTGGRKATVFGSAPATTGFSSSAVGLFTHPNQYGGGILGDSGLVTTDHAPSVNDPLTGTTAGKYLFSFQLSVAAAAQSLDTSAWTIKPSMSIQSNYWDTTHTITGNKPLLSVTESSGNIILTSATGAPGGAAFDTIIKTGFSALTPYTVAATLDMDTRTFTLTLDGVQVGGTYNQLVASTPGLGIGQYEAYGGRPDGTKTNEGFFYFYDNINLQSVPEPSTFLLLGLGLSALLAARKRKS